MEPWFLEWKVSVHFSRERLLSSKFKTWPSILDHWNSRLNPLEARPDPQKFRESRIESRVSRIKAQVTVNLLLSGTVQKIERIALYKPYTCTWISHRLVICQLTVGKLINACCENVMADEITTCFATNVKYAASSLLARLLLIHLTVSYKLPLLLPNEFWKNSPVSSSLWLLNYKSEGAFLQL